MRKFGLLGKKLSHSLSPLLHNIFFEDLGLNNEYKLYEVEESEVENFKSYMLENSIEGVNITVPYKKVLCNNGDSGWESLFPRSPNFLIVIEPPYLYP